MAKYVSEANLRRFWGNIQGQIASASQEQVNAWLDAHPEATTTVQDGSITDAKLVQTGGVLEVANGASVDVGTLLGTSNLDSFYFEKGSVTAQGGNDNSWRYAVRARSKARVSFKTNVVIKGDTPIGTMPSYGYAQLQIFEYDPNTETYGAPTAWGVEAQLAAGVEYRILFDGAFGVGSPAAMTLEEVLARFTVVSDIDVRTMRDELDSLLDDSEAIPSYYFDNDYLDGKASTVQQRSFVNGVSFGFITDVHTGDSACNSMKLARYIDNKTSALPFMLFGGDVPETNTGTEAGLYEQAAKWQQMMAQYGKHRVYSCHGNHDYLSKLSDNSDFSTSWWTAYSYGMGYMPDNIHLNANGNMSYYFDIPGKSTRFIVLDQYSGSNKPTFTGYAVMAAADYTWLVDVALNVSDYKVIILMHQPLNLTGGEGYTNTLALLESVISGFAQHTHVQGSYGPAVVDKDFTNNTSELVCVLAGHIHKDASGTSDGYLTIVTTSDAPYTTDGYTRTMGTVTEGAFDCISVDFDARKIYCTRIGAGSDREFSY